MLLRNDRSSCRGETPTSRATSAIASGSSILSENSRIACATACGSMSCVRSARYPGVRCVTSGPRTTGCWNQQATSVMISGPRSSSISFNIRSNTAVAPAAVMRLWSMLITALRASIFGNSALNAAS